MIQTGYVILDGTLNRFVPMIKLKIKS